MRNVKLNKLKINILLSFLFIFFLCDAGYLVMQNTNPAEGGVELQQMSRQSEKTRDGPTIIKERCKKRKLMAHDAENLAILKMEALVSSRERAITVTLTRQQKQQKVITNLIHEISPLATLVLYSLRTHWPWLLCSTNQSKDSSISASVDHLSNRRSTSTEADITDVVIVRNESVILAYEIWMVTSSIVSYYST